MMAELVWIMCGGWVGVDQLNYLPDLPALGCVFLCVVEGKPVCSLVIVLFSFCGGRSSLLLMITFKV